MSIVGKLGGIEGQQTISEVITPGGGSEGAGLRLYGPYWASGRDTIPAGLAGQVSLESMEDSNFMPVTFPDADADAAVFVVAAGLNDGNILRGFSAPYVVSKVSGLEWDYGTLLIFNNGESASEMGGYLTFYSTVEFPKESQ